MSTGSARKIKAIFHTDHSDNRACRMRLTPTGEAQTDKTLPGSLPIAQQAGHRAPLIFQANDHLSKNRAPSISRDADIFSGRLTLLFTPVI